MSIIKFLQQYFGNKNKLLDRAIKLEKAQYKDLDFIMQCINDGVKEGHFKPIQREQIEEVLKAKNSDSKTLSHIFIINFNNNAIGISIITERIKQYAIINHSNNEELYGLEINMLYVVENFRNKGIATKVISFHERETNFPNILVRCEQSNSKEAISLFKKLGYKDIGINRQPNHKLTHMILKKVIIKNNHNK